MSISAEREEDRRRDDRYTLLLRGLALGPRGDVPVDVVASNLSRSGLLLHANRAEGLLEGDLVTLSFPYLVPDHAIRVNVGVSWRRPATASALGRWMIGVRFLGEGAAGVNDLVDAALAADGLRGPSVPIGSARGPGAPA